MTNRHFNYQLEKLQVKEDNRRRNTYRREQRKKNKKQKRQYPKTGEFAILKDNTEYIIQEDEDHAKLKDNGKVQTAVGLLKSEHIYDVFTTRLNLPSQDESPKSLEKGDGSMFVSRIKRLTTYLVRYSTLKTIQMKRLSQNRRSEKEEKEAKKDKIRAEMKKILQNMSTIVEKMTGVKYSGEQLLVSLILSKGREPSRPSDPTLKYTMQCLVHQELSIAFGTVWKYTPFLSQPVDFQPSACRSFRDLILLTHWSAETAKTFYLDRILHLPLAFRQWEIDNFDKLLPFLTTDGDSIRYQGNELTLKPNPTMIEDTVGRTFNSGEEVAFKFEFEGEKDWDDQIRKIKNIEQFTNLDTKLASTCKEARPAGDCWFATFVYLHMLRKTQPNAYNFLLTTDFLKMSENIDNYQKQCKKFTSFLKTNKDAVERKYNFDAVTLFELEQLSGFRTRSVVPDWQENIGDWIAYKSNTNTPLAAYFAKVELAKQINTDKWNTLLFEERYLNNAAIFNADGAAKGEKLSMQKYSAEESFVPKTVRMNKTGFNLLQTPNGRKDLSFNKRVMFGFPVQKKEITKVRYIINTDLGSHYALAPLEALLADSLKHSDVYNMNSLAHQQEQEKRWMTSKIPKLCADQSSFDHYCAKASFYQLFGYIRDKLDGEMRELAALAMLKFTTAAIFVTAQENTSRWMSGMLSGWKITSIGDSLINLCQMRYAIEATGRHSYQIKVQGDDVLLESLTVSAEKVTTTMNAMGLVQHPDKTISSVRYSEFLRNLYDSEGNSKQGYPARLMPSLLFEKPWSNAYSSEEWSGDTILQRIKNWRSLAGRLRIEHSDDTLTRLIAADVHKSARLPISRTRFVEMLKSPILAMRIQASRFEEEAAKLKPGQMYPKEGRVSKDTLKRLIVNNLAAQGKMTVREIVPMETGTKVISLDRMPLVIPKAPLPQMWLKQMTNSMSAEQLLETNMLWGRPWAKATESYKNWLSNPELYEKYYLNDLMMKSEFSYILPVQDLSVARAIQAIKGAAQQSDTRDQLQQTLDTLYKSTDWLAMQRVFFGTNNIFT